MEATHAHGNCRRVVLVAAALSSSAAAQDQGVLTYHNDAARSGHYVVPGLTWDKARALRLDSLFAPRVDGHLYAQPLLWRVESNAMLITASEDNVVQAFDGQTGNELWRRVVGTPVPRSSLPCGNISPLGITGTPVIDPASQGIYLNAAVLESNGPRHKIFGLALKDGAVLPSFPVDVADALRASGRSFTPPDQNQRAALTIVDGALYVAYSGHFGDCGDYRGWVIGVPLRDPNTIASWSTRARGGGIWAPGGISAVGREMFFATGNTFGASTWSDGEGVFRVRPGLERSDNPRDFFAPSDWQALDDLDADLSGTNPVPLDVSGGNGTQALILALGKNRKAFCSTATTSAASRAASRCKPFPPGS